MILVFIFLGLILLTSTLISVLLLSSIKIKIYDLKTKNFKLENENYKIYIQIYFLNRLKILSMKLDSKKLKKISLSKRFNRPSLKELLKNNNVFKSIKKLHLKVEELRLNIDIGTEDAPATAYLATTVSGIIGMNMPKITNKKHIIENNIYYKINPIYNKNILIINLIESIISIKIVHIISMLIYGKKKLEISKKV